MKNNQLLLNKDFALLWTGKFISQTGDKFYALALAWWLLMKTNSASLMGLLLILSLAPGLLAGAFCGPLIDRWNKKKIIVWTDAIRGALILLAALLAAFNRLEVWEVMTVSLCVSAASAFFDPASMAIIPRLVSGDELPRANSLNQLISGVCTVLGPAAGALAISMLGIPAVFMLNALSYFISMLLSMAVSYAPIMDQPTGSTYLVNIKEGLRFISGNKLVRFVIIVIGIAHLFVGGIMVSLPFLAKALPGRGVSNLGNLETMMGVGLIAASLLMSRVKKEVVNLRTLLKIMTAAGCMILLIGLVNRFTQPSLYYYMFCFAGLGAAIAAASVFWQSLLHRSTPEQMTGRVFSISALAGNISLPAAFGVYGLLLDRVPYSMLMMLSGLILITANTMIALLKTE